MNHREPDAPHPNEFAGASGGQAVWEGELPWQLTSLDETAIPDPNVGATSHRFSGGGPEGDGATALIASPSLGNGTDIAPSANQAMVDRPTPQSRSTQVRASAARRTRGRDGGVAGGGRRAHSRTSLVKPVLAGAGVLSALFLLIPSGSEENAPAQTVHTGAEDIDPEHTPDQPDPAESKAPAQSSSGPVKDGPDPTGKVDRIAEVAATGPNARLVSSGKPSATKAPRDAGTPKPGATAQVPDWTTTVVQGTRALDRGQSWSTNRITLLFQGDGNLVLFDNRGKALWSSGTAGRGATTVFQADGNLAVYSADKQTAWSSRTDGHNGAELRLREDGNMVIQQGGTVLWSSGTTL